MEAKRLRQLCSTNVALPLPVEKREEVPIIWSINSNTEHTSGKTLQSLRLQWFVFSRCYSVYCTALSIFGDGIYHLTAKPCQGSASSAWDNKTRLQVRAEAPRGAMETVLVMDPTQLQLWQHPEVRQTEQVAWSRPLNMTRVLEKVKIHPGQLQDVPSPSTENTCSLWAQAPALV